MENIKKENILIGNSSFIKDLNCKIRGICSSNSPVLIYGPTGTGKSYLTSLIHQLSEKDEKKYVVVNCASLNINLFESELFGHKKGSFTGAVNDQKGKLELANGGTLVLEEIGNLSLQMQAKFLSVLESKTITPIGTLKEINVDFRLICTTSQNLSELLDNKLLREDFLYRINVVTLSIPPIILRSEDILPYFEHFLKNKIEINLDNPEIKKTILEHSWPGNLKEMNNLILRLSILNEPITPELLKLVIYEEKMPGIHIVPDFFFTIKEIQKIYSNYVYKSLKSKKKAAEQLKISVKTLNKYLKQ